MSTSAPLEETTKTPLSTREKLLESAKECLLEHGHAASTVKTIAQTAGVNHGLVHHYFQSKEHLFAELLNCGSSEIQEKFNQVQTLEELCEFYTNHFFANTKLIVEFFAMANQMQSIAEYLRQIMFQRREMLAQKLQIDDPIDRLLVPAAILGLGLQSNLDPDLPVAEAIRRLFERFNQASPSCCKTEEPGLPSS